MRRAVLQEHCSVRLKAKPSKQRIAASASLPTTAATIPWAITGRSRPRCCSASASTRWFSIDSS